MKQKMYIGNEYEVSIANKGFRYSSVEFFGDVYTHWTLSFLEDLKRLETYPAL